MADVENATHNEAVAAPASAPSSSSGKKWYALRVQANREDVVKEALEKRIRQEGLEAFFGQIVVPVERVTEVVRGKKVTRTHKLYPGYLMVEVEFNDKIHSLIREVPGVGDFVGVVGNRPPPPLSEAEVQRVLGQRPDVVSQTAPASRIKFDRGERVKIKEGMFAGMEGEVIEVLESKGLVRVMLKLLGREVPVEIEHWQLEHA